MKRTKYKKVTASIASMPSRKFSLQETVDSLLPQVNEIHVYLNDYDHVPEYLHDKKIKVFLSQDESGDIGDVGKFYTCESIKGYHFTSDDDLIYPPDYVKTMIDAIEKHDRKFIIGLHGRKFDNLPVKSYYRGHTEAFCVLKNVIGDHIINVIGTGAMAFHTDTLNLELTAFQNSNMADVWFSKFANDKNVPLMCIGHRKGWIKHSNKYDHNLCIYRSCNRIDELQTQVINTTSWNKYVVV